MEYKYKGPIIKKKTYFCTLYLAKLDFNKSKYILLTSPDYARCMNTNALGNKHIEKLAL